MTIRLEHANLIVRDIDGMVKFLETAFPEFGIRGEGTNNGSRWLHIGSESTYIALNEADSEPNETWRAYAGKPGLNHLGYEVDDAEALRNRMLTAGYRDSTVPNNHEYRKRVYFYDPEGNDWEFVQYFSEDPAERNAY
jgi:catechol 2,3-dioxygenase-like lactoylglutathione lyase family enzyme